MSCSPSLLCESPSAPEDSVFHEALSAEAASLSLASVSEPAVGTQFLLHCHFSPPSPF